MNDSSKKINGVLVVYKPQGITSAHCLAKVKRALNLKKAGHAGTLDPMATGVLLLLLGEATKLSSYLMNNKVYSGCIELGKTTDTWDAEGKIISTAAIDKVEKKDVELQVDGWVAETTQEVPPYSAAKHNGEALYSLSRRGLPTPVKIKNIKIFNAQLLNYTAPLIEFRVECSSGTYIRSLAHSLGMRLGCGATLTKLTREYSHPFGLGDAISMEEAERSPEEALAKVVSIASSLPNFTHIKVSSEEEADIRNGKQIVCQRAFENGEHMLLMSENGAPLALAEAVPQDLSGALPGVAPKASITGEGNAYSLKILRGLWN